MTGLLALQNSGSKYFVVLFCLLVLFFFGGGGMEMFTNVTLL